MSLLLTKQIPPEGWWARLVVSQFAARMALRLVDDAPVTIWIDSRAR